MPKNSLSNHKVREQGLLSLLKASKLDTQIEDLNDSEPFIAMQLKTAHSSIVHDLASLLKIQEVKSLNAVELMLRTLENSTTTQTENLRACLGLFNIFANNIRLDTETFELCCDLPTLEIASLFSSVRHNLQRVTGTQLRFNLEEYLKSQSDSYFQLDKGMNGQPTLVLNGKVLENNPVYFVQEEVNADQVRVSPFVYLPQQQTPPVYHFVLDLSGSMRDDRKIDELRDSVRRFAYVLFNYHQNAELHIHVFNTQLSLVGIFKATDEKFQRTIDQLTPSGETALYATAEKMLKVLSQSPVQNNVLLFTDGRDTRPTQDLSYLDKTLGEFAPSQLARNKFFIVSYETQPDRLTELTQRFGSAFILYKSPDLQRALSDHNQLAAWAAARDLLTVRVCIQQTSENNTHTVWAEPGQVVPLPSIIVNKGHTVEINVGTSLQPALTQASLDIPARPQVVSEDTNTETAAAAPIEGKREQQPIEQQQIHDAGLSVFSSAPRSRLRRVGELLDNARKNCTVM
ncbi:Uncharacterised protein (plasmid) [Legionella adelaidensis]|uniref:VWFA domain-containing protein n=1 Tax=Legionella adelaidensis TaxID=45056 RepID=A0A0W0R3F1_9GAMM|nr:vWA domain-containing protein [Legionella adelaidensis]KTC65570.1 hypothetical protein Lade_0228 [Legionella adelaidensis]VEH85738.1 Uncharacterised protein [Legionella adelaidensis]